MCFYLQQRQHWIVDHQWTANILLEEEHLTPGDTLIKCGKITKIIQKKTALTTGGGRRVDRGAVDC